MTTILSPIVRFRYEEAYRKWQQIQYPAAVKAGGFLNTKYPDTRTANGLTMFVCNFIKWNGYRSTRIASSGRIVKAPQRQASGTVLLTSKYIPGTTRKGTADISATIKGRSVMLEIKVGKDRPSEYQLREQQIERAAGGLYEFIRDPEQFILWYDQFLLSL